MEAGYQIIFCTDRKFFGLRPFLILVVQRICADDLQGFRCPTY